MYRKDLFHLILLGVAGFVLGHVFFTPMSSTNDEGGGYSLLFATIFAGVPFGWKLSYQEIL